MPWRAASTLFPIFLLAVLPVLSGQPFEGYHEETAPTGKVYWRGWGEADRKAVLDLLPGALEKAEALLARRSPGPFTTVLVPDQHELRRAAERLLGEDGGLPRSWQVAGVAFPGPRVLIVRGDFLPGGGSFSRTITHEIAHLVIHGGSPATRIPRWFDEGAATWIADPVLPPQEESSMSLLARLDALYPLSSLETRFPGAHDPASIAYRQSLLFITYLVEEHGESAVPRLLDLFEKGADGEEALQALSSRPASEVEAAFAGWVVRRASLFQAILSVVSLWTVAALLAVAAAVRYQLRRRRRLAQLGEDDLSSRKAERIRGWERVIATCQEGDIVRGKVMRKIKGGLLLEIGVPVFLPASQLGIRNGDGIDLVGQELECKIVKIDRSRMNIVVSRKLLEEEGENSAGEADDPAGPSGFPEASDEKHRGAQDGDSA